MTNDELRELVRTLRDLGVTEYESIGIKLKLGRIVDDYIPPGAYVGADPETEAAPVSTRDSMIDALVGKPRAA